MKSILEALYDETMPGRILLRAVLRLSEKYGSEAVDAALAALETARTSDERIIVRTWEHSSVQNHDYQPCVESSVPELLPPEGVPEHIYSVLRGLLFSSRDVHLLRVLTGRRFIMSPGIHTSGLELWSEE